MPREVRVVKLGLELDFPFFIFPIDDEFNRVTVTLLSVRWVGLFACNMVVVVVY
jgi:hypothetical protein